MPSFSMALGERADAEARGVLGAEVLVDDDDGKAKLHAVLVKPRRDAGKCGKWGALCAPRGPNVGSRAAQKASGSPASLARRNRPAAATSSAYRFAATMPAADARSPSAQRRAQPPAPRQVLLRRHHGREHEHPAEVAGADDEHERASAPSSSRRRRGRGRGRGATPRAAARGRASARMMKENGVWHCSRQRYLSALNWNAPAPASTAAPSSPAVRPSPRQRARPPMQRARRPRARRGRTRTRRRRTRRRRAPRAARASGRPATMRRNSASSG